MKLLITLGSMIFLLALGQVSANTINPALTNYQTEMLNTVRMLAGVLITLSAGTIVISFSFLQIFPKKTVKWRGFLISSWLLLLASLGFGIVFYGSLAYDLGSDVFNPVSATWRVHHMAQWIAFAGGIIVFAIFAIKNVLSTSSTKPPKGE